jgi:hypothetical protein
MIVSRADSDIPSRTFGYARNGITSKTREGRVGLSVIGVDLLGRRRKRRTPTPPAT